ncbi:hypothetical protein [Clostridium tetanomorphum]|uniref:Uncharacterized protein n=2 Tax=Clostridium tetanomorphum TaxID=1553 RepID=A0A923EAS7_CLOTT|nr:hypothetical protein [Clostridium tetanomorphum]MBC2399615.1 hypothetical protein [Clostridium tetanomorphum]NRZ95988.1 hypothetical protein [Clostridium tetanomorphum]
MMFCDGEFVRDMSLKKVVYDENGIYAMCFVGEGRQIIARIDFKDGKKHDYRVDLTCYDKNNNVVETNREKDTTYGDAEIGWLILPEWHAADVTFFLDGRRINLGLTR